MSKRMMVLRLGYVQAALSNFYLTLNKRGLVQVLRQTVKEVYGALKRS